MFAKLVHARGRQLDETRCECYTCNGFSIYMLDKIKNINPGWLVPITIAFFVCIATVALGAADGNPVFILFAHFFGNCFLVVFIILIFSYSAYQIYIYISPRITKSEIKKLGMDWESLKEVFIASGWGKEISYSLEGATHVMTGEIYLIVDPEARADELRNHYGSQLLILLPLLKKKWNVPPKQRWIKACGIAVLMWITFASLCWMVVHNINVDLQQKIRALK